VVKHQGTLLRWPGNSRLWFLFAVASTLAACNDVSSLSGPTRLYTVTEEVQLIRGYFESPGSASAATSDSAVRNNIIAARMYAIDLEYSEFEARLLREGQVVDFTTKLTSGVLTTVAGLIPSLSTSHALSETATLVNGLDSAYNDKILKSQIIQSVLASMRTARHDQAAIIYANMYCPTTLYPLGIALGDVETYYRAGTFQTGLIRLMQTVGKAETDAKASQDSNKPAPAPDATAQIAANSTAANVKAAATNPAQSAAPVSGLANAACKLPAGFDRVSFQPMRGSPVASVRAQPKVAIQASRALPSVH
jgi:hypothetical protein